MYGKGRSDYVDSSLTTSLSHKKNWLPNKVDIAQSVERLIVA